MDLSELGIDIDIEKINIKIKDKFVKVLNGELESFQISDINNFSFYLDIINSFLDDPIDIGDIDFNGYDDDFHHEFSFKNRNFIFEGALFYNNYKILVDEFDHEDEDESSDENEDV
jgi:hypothetical protein